METSGQWLQKALVDLCQRIETGLGLGMDIDMISGLVSYCELAHPQDAKEYLDNIVGQEAGKSVIDEYLQRRGHSDVGSSTPNVPTSKLQAYVKPRSDEASVSGTRKPKAPKVVSVPSSHAEPKKHMVSSHQENQVSSETNESRTMQKGNQVSSKKKKAGKVISLAEAAKGSIVFQQGKPCSCQARRHKLVSNCLSCGKIVCEQEGEGPCSFCGSLVLKEGSTYAGLDESLPLQSDAEATAEAYAKRLVEYDRNSAARTTVIDDQSDYYEIEGNSWLSKDWKASLAYFPLFLLRCFSSRSILRGFSATRFVLEFSLIALRATSRWPLQQLKPAEPSDVLVWLRELIQDLSYIRLAFNGSAMFSIISTTRKVAVVCLRSLQGFQIYVSGTHGAIDELPLDPESDFYSIPNSPKLLALRAYIRHQYENDSIVVGLCQCVM